MSPEVIVVVEVTTAAQLTALFAGAVSGVVVILRMAGDRLAAAGARLLWLGAERPALDRVPLGGVERVLVRRLCADCRSPTRLTADEASALGVGADADAARPLGCSRCRSGYAGRRPVYGVWRDGRDWPAA